MKPAPYTVDTDGESVYISTQLPEGTNVFSAQRALVDRFGSDRMIVSSSGGPQSLHFGILPNFRLQTFASLAEADQAYFLAGDSFTVPDSISQIAVSLNPKEAARVKELRERIPSSAWTNEDMALLRRAADIEAARNRSVEEAQKDLEMRQAEAQRRIRLQTRSAIADSVYITLADITQSKGMILDLRERKIEVLLDSRQDPITKRRTRLGLIIDEGNSALAAQSLGRPGISHVDMDLMGEQFVDASSQVVDVIYRLRLEAVREAQGMIRLTIQDVLSSDSKGFSPADRLKGKSIILSPELLGLPTGQLMATPIAADLDKPAEPALVASLHGDAKVVTLPNIRNSSGSGAR